MSTTSTSPEPDLPSQAEATEERDRLVAWLGVYDEQTKMVGGVRERIAFLNGLLAHRPRAVRRAAKKK